MTAPLPAGATLGILGGGQLGRMTALAAARLGYRVHVFAPQADAPAAHVTPRFTCAPYEDDAALARFADAVDVVTFEFENVDAHVAAVLADHVPVRPHPRVLQVCQDRTLEKRAVAACGGETAPWREATTPEEAEAAAEAIGRPAVLKTARLGYDGKGQALVRAPGDAAAAYARFGRRCILEGFVDFACEVSVLAARDVHGRVVTYPVVMNEHRDHILWRTTVPAPVSREVAAAARSIATRLVESLDVVGLLAVEMFVTRDGHVLVNELAPRPHNSGHWTQDACETCQFEQLVRAVTGLPLGGTRALGPCTMTNLLGDEVDTRDALLARPAHRVHVYDKGEARPGRKMGHVTHLRWLDAGDGEQGG